MTIGDVNEDLFNKNCKCRLFYDIDCGHVLPKFILNYGAVGKVEVKVGKEIIMQRSL